MDKRSFSIAGHRTSIALEPEFWLGFEAIARHRGVSLAALVRHVDETRETANLSSAIRLAVLAWYRDAQSSTGAGDAGSE